MIALEIGKLEYELDEDGGSLPADIGRAAPSWNNAYSEADTILEYVDQHMGDTRIMPSDVEAYYSRATSVAHCSEQLAKTTYHSAYEHLLLAVLAINNLMVIADSNAEEKLIHAARASRSGPIIIKVQNSYTEQSPTQNQCTGTVLHLGSALSTINWNCQP